ncbi:hypothetical protein DPMN_071458 [Dreissena polymorpha]|uniref:Uncharacterized protein n=1 Tax=Dreissena polymorpha TaxID=45954 RepID=A0A9D4BW89_DREPO|nr:hypothetical protein DPMN_071458 [Dreissena polymorpha]
MERFIVGAVAYALGLLPDDSSSDDDFEAYVQPKHVEEQTRDMLSRPYYRPEKAVEQQKLAFDTTKKDYEGIIKKLTDKLSAALTRYILIDDFSHTTILHVFAKMKIGI